ncbi:MAG: hypothetical protein ACRDPK_01510 [Carbonactinosporaceae bacterium]
MNELMETRDGYAAAGFPLYALDSMWRGRRWLGELRRGDEGAVEYAALGHGDEPSRRPGDPLPRRFVIAVTVPQRARRPCGATSFIEATSRESAAALAGVGLLEISLPWDRERGYRKQWMEQQVETAWELAQQLEDRVWAPLALPVGGVPARMRYRESGYGWVCAGESAGVFLGVYGRGVSPFGLALEAVSDLSGYDEPYALNGMRSA